MDPNATLAQWIAGGTLAEIRQLAHDYNAWVLKGGFCAEAKVWSNKVFGVPVHATVKRLGTKRAKCILTYNGETWPAELLAGRFV